MYHMIPFCENKMYICPNKIQNKTKQTTWERDIMLLTVVTKDSKIIMLIFSLLAYL